MNTIEAIAKRRSIRKYTGEPLAETELQAILQAAQQAPSGKNRQPWKLVVVQSDKRPEMIQVMRTGIAKTKARGYDTGSAEWSANFMEQAQATVFLFNPLGIPPWKAHTVDQMFDDVVDIQSIGAAIQNMLLAAEDLGIGSLWICDVFSAYAELQDWLGEPGEMIAAVAFGHPAENPPARPRKAMSEIARFV
jgi:nitroreductase